MTKKQTTERWQKRDVVIAVLTVAIVITNWVWYQQAKSQDRTDESTAQYDTHLQSQINALKVCIDQETRPCSVGP